MQNYRDLAIAASRGILSHMASPLIAQMGISKATSTPIALLDSACGSGVVTQEVHKVLAREILDRSSILCADVTPAMTEIVKWRVENEPWVNTETRTLDAMVKPRCLGGQVDHGHVADTGSPEHQTAR